MVHGASRTDAGVHALGQVAHFRTQSPLSATEIQRALNALLPPAIRIVDAEETGPDFHARWQAQGKRTAIAFFAGASCRPSNTAARCTTRGRSTRTQWPPPRANSKASTISARSRPRPAPKKTIATAT